MKSPILNIIGSLLMINNIKKSKKTLVIDKQTRQDIKDKINKSNESKKYCNNYKGSKGLQFLKKITKN